MEDSGAKGGKRAFAATRTNGNYAGKGLLRGAIIGKLNAVRGPNAVCLGLGLAVAVNSDVKASAELVYTRNTFGDEFWGWRQHHMAVLISA